MKLKVSKQTETGLNVEFVNIETNRTIGLEQAIGQIKKGNPNYKDYIVVNNSGTEYIRSKPDSSTKNNIED